MVSLGVDGVEPERHLEVLEGLIESSERPERAREARLQAAVLGVLAHQAFVRLHGLGIASGLEVQGSEVAVALR